MSEQPEALRLANRMALIGASMDGDADRAAAELRRLYALCEEQRNLIALIERHCTSTVKTNSKDVRDWIDDVAFIGKMANEALPKWKESK